ncbi:MAG: hypothetical protein LQ341_006079 [Variospora aurantia]|nr:MAG: hypothetical protein LQ341_006079 [Variospora aurantia]
MSEIVDHHIDQLLIRLEATLQIRGTLTTDVTRHRAYQQDWMDDFLFSTVAELRMTDPSIRNGPDALNRMFRIRQAMYSQGLANYCEDIKKAISNQWTVLGNEIRDRPEPKTQEYKLQGYGGRSADCGCSSITPTDTQEEIFLRWIDEEQGYHIFHGNHEMTASLPATKIIPKGIKSITQSRTGKTLFFRYTPDFLSGSLLFLEMMSLAEANKLRKQLIQEAGPNTRYYFRSK